MFTGIVETLGTVRALAREGSNARLRIEAAFAGELKIDQSVAHNGVCLTVVATEPQASCYEVVAIAETLQRTNLGLLRAGGLLNLERCLRADARLDGHFVLGHVDCTGTIESIETLDGSWKLRVAFPPTYAPMVVAKGSVCLNGISLTVVDALEAGLTVAIIPYTWAHTNLRTLRPGDAVNLEFDILGKHVARLASFNNNP